MMEFHPVANIFPMMTEDEYRALVNDIAEHGQREAIWTYHGQIIDGRNRYKACVELGVKPIVREWSGEGSLIEFVVSMNLHRRHLSSSQKAVIALDILPMLEAEARERQRAAAQETNEKRYGGLMGRMMEQDPLIAANVNRAERRTESLKEKRKLYFIRDGDRVKIGISVDPEQRLKEIRVSVPQANLIGSILTVDGLEPELHKELSRWNVGGEWFTWSQEVSERVESLLAFPKIGKSELHATKATSKIIGVSHGYISDAKKLSEHAPDLLDDVRSGEKTITDAKRELKEREREVVREANRTLVEEVPPLVTTALLQRYQTIVIDPPWDWGDEGDCDQYGRARPTYATMPIEEVAALPVPELVQNNAHIYLWITNRSLPKGFALLDQWGFRYVTALTWVKPSFGMGNYYRGSTEHVLFGVRGSLALLRHDLSTHFAAPRPGSHSGKPDHFYQMVESASPGPWLEMFSRNPRPGWVAWGAEASVDANRN